MTFNLSNPAFSRNLALFLARACEVAYEDDPGKAAQREMGLTSAESFDHPATDTQGFVGRSDDFAVLAFRGSERLNQHPKDWTTDLNVPLVQVQGYPGKIHTGFSNAFTSAWSMAGGIDGLLRKALSAATAAGAAEPGLPLFITGHSLGGALATLAACRLAAGPLPAAAGAQALKVNLMATYTFGAPRVGNVDFCSAYKPVTHRVVHNHDVVPLVPFDSAELGNVAAKLLALAPPWAATLIASAQANTSYAHVKELVYLDADGTVTLGKDRPGWLISYLSQAFLTLDVQSFRRSLEAAVTDHFIHNYITGLASRAW